MLTDGNKDFVSQLLEVGADPEIANRAGLRPLDFGVGTESNDDRNGASQGGQQNLGLSTRSTQISISKQTQTSSSLPKRCNMATQALERCSLRRTSSVQLC